MQTSRALTLACISLTALACETTIVFPGEMVSFDQDDLFIGAAGTDEVGARTAIDFGPGAQVTVAGAIVLGGAFVGPGPGNAAPGIRAGGTLIVTGGTIQGGAVAIPPGEFFRGLSGAGVDAWRSTVRIAGGQLRGGTAPVGGLVSSGVEATMSTVAVSGGAIDAGRFLQSRMILIGGEIGRIDLSALTFSQTETLPDGTTETRSATLGSCGEIRGGTLRGTIGVVQSDLFVVGARFNLPFGPIQTTPVRLVGELADGSAVDTMIFTPGRTVLLPTPAPGSPQAVPGTLCPLSVVDLPNLFPEIPPPPPPPPPDDPTQP